MLTVYILLGSFVSLYVLWIYYLATMAIWKAELEGIIPPAVRPLALSVVWVGMLLDTLLNWLVLSPILWETPREYTISDRLRRIVQTETGWKLQVAQAFQPLLDPFDPTGKHI